MLKRKKPPKWWLISSYKIVLQVWSGGLFTDAEVLEEGVEHGLGGDFADNVAQMVDALAQVLTDEVARQVGAQCGYDALDG